MQKRGRSLLLIDRLDRDKEPVKLKILPNDYRENDGRVRGLKPPPLIRGWHAADPEEKAEAVANNRMLHIYAGTSHLCDLGCIYCHTAGGRPMKGEMSLAERKDVLRQARQLGCKYVHISGAGEPTIDPYVWDQIDYINELGMIPTIFTHARHCTKQMAKWFYENNCSVMVKIHSADETLQDFYANVKGYGRQRDVGLRNLMDAGLNDGEPTRLGADLLMMTENKEEMPHLWRWCRQNNIFPLVKSELCMEEAVNSQARISVHPKDVEQMFYRLLAIDESEFGFSWVPSPPWSAVRCEYNYYHVQVTIEGHIKPCIGFEPLGNMRDMENALLYYWDHPMQRRIRNFKKEVKGTCGSCKEACYGCPCRRISRYGQDKVFETDGCWESNL